MDTSEEYRRFAREQAAGTSPAYEALAYAVANDTELLHLLDGLPEIKRQPNLLFGVVRHQGGPLDPERFVPWVVEHWPDVSAEMMVRRTQTNEPARCATLLPVLAGLPGPLALLEVGTSAGLCLYPDRYRYDYGTKVVGDEHAPFTIPCAVTGNPPLPDQVPEIVWRAGIDLNPLDVRNEDDLSWLTSLVWPEHDDRRARLRAAAEMERRDPPLLVQGDLNDALPGVAAHAPEDATLVVFHTAVLMYLTVEERSRFVGTVTALPGHWISNESPELLADHVPPPVEPSQEPGLFLTALDGRPCAWSEGHGRSLHWLMETGLRG